MTKTTLTDGSPVSPDHRELKPNGQQRDYVVLSEEERAKGFVRPVRQEYQHVGQAVCGKYGPNDEKTMGGMVYICIREPGHEGDCQHFRGLPQPEAEAAHRNQRLPGCDAITKMALSIAETYARDPKFYSGTYCIGCRVHLPLNQFVWKDTNEVVGT